jgi:hypothetical protein
MMMRLVKCVRRRKPPSMVVCDERHWDFSVEKKHSGDKGYKSISTRLPDEAPGHLYVIWMDENSPVAPPDPRFRPDLGFHPCGEPRPSLAPRGALGDSGRNESVGNAEKTSRAAGDAAAGGGYRVAPTR